MKAEKTTDHASVHEHISRVVMGLEDSGTKIILPSYVANVVDSRIDTHRIAPHLTRYLSLEQLKSNVRKFLAKRFNPEEVVNQKLESGTEDLFGDVLQDYYPAKRNVMGEEQQAYVQREELTEEEMNIVASKMEKAGQALLEHAKALRAWFYSK